MRDGMLGFTRRQLNEKQPNGNSQGCSPNLIAEISSRDVDLIALKTMHSATWMAMDFMFRR